MAGSEKPDKEYRKRRGNGEAQQNSEFGKEPPEPAAAPRSRRHFYAEEPVTDTPDSDAATDLSSDFAALKQRAEATLTLATAWSENFSQLVHLEFQRTLSAGKRILVLALVLFFLAVALLVSLCAGLGLLGYYLTQSIYIGFGIFLVTQVLVVAALLLSINSLRKLLGFEESKNQAREALNDVTALFKQTD